MANLFALRSKNPTALRKSRDPIGPANDIWLIRLASEADVVLAAWGNGGRFLNRSDVIRTLLPNLVILGLTKSGHPRHPLYMSGTTEPVPWDV